MQCKQNKVSFWSHRINKQISKHFDIAEAASESLLTLFTNQVSQMGLASFWHFWYRCFIEVILAEQLFFKTFAQSSLQVHLKDELISRESAVTCRTRPQTRSTTVGRRRKSASQIGRGGTDRVRESQSRRRSRSFGNREQIWQNKSKVYQPSSDLRQSLCFCVIWHVQLHKRWT